MKLPLKFLRRRFASGLLAARLRLGGKAPIAAGMRRIRNDAWQSVDNDPRMEFNPPIAPSVITLFVDAAPATVRPRVYFDWGDGYHESDSFDVGSAKSFLIRISFRDTRGLKRVRFDPVEGRAKFRFRFSSSAADETADRHIDIDPLDYAPAGAGRNMGLKRRPRDAHEEFLRIVETARHELTGQEPTAESTPLISFVTPVYNTPVAYLDDLLRSFRLQPRGICELVLSDDGSTSTTTDAWLKAHASEPDLVIIRAPANKGIAAACNAGIAAARGQWIGFVDHDDALAPEAVAVLARAIRERPEVQFIYTDELIANARLRGVDFFLKPAFDDVLLSGVNYINHLSLYRRDLLNAIGGFREGFDGSQDYDLLLRYLAKPPSSNILHIPYPAYIWRRDGASYSVKFLDRATSNARRALAEAYGVETGEAVNPDLHRVRFKASSPKVSIIIPNADDALGLDRLLGELRQATDYPDLEILLVNAGATEIAASDANIRRLRAPAKLPISRQMNIGIHHARGDVVVLLDGAVEPTEPDWLREMVSCLRYRDVGIVGARLLNRDRTLRHAGLIVGLGGLADPWFVGREADFPGPMARLNVRSSLSAVSSECMLISRPCWERVGPFDEEHFGLAYHDVDYCLRAALAGFRTVYTPFATLVRHPDPADVASGLDRAHRLRDQAALIELRGTPDFQDRYFSPWYDREHSEPRRITLDALPAAR